MKKMAVSVAASRQFCSPPLRLSPPPSPPSASPPVSSPPPHLRSCSCHLHACPRTWHEIAICFSNSVLLAFQILSSLPVLSASLLPHSIPPQLLVKALSQLNLVSKRIDLFKAQVKDLKWGQVFFRKFVLYLSKTIP